MEDIDDLLREFSARMKASLRKVIIEDLISRASEDDHGTNGHRRGKANGKGRANGHAKAKGGYPRYAKANGKPGKKRKHGNHRGPEIIAKLAERMFAKIKEKPGLHMAEIDLGCSSQEKHLPMVKLIEAGRVRQVGVRAQAKYFPKN